ncbi:hypothetical protein AAFF_G00352240 [Aldrovandia affinis]|uniref:Uncharacterized protein n=1 Tax=Aldrovandia affinis TaxID=143900 RepID=A0AAD7WNI0_9TELE|nr:hypothetical protein AAFF_G00352240 [Aldrovandia affinis]
MTAGGKKDLNNKSIPACCPPKEQGLWGWREKLYHKRAWTPEAAGAPPERAWQRATVGPRAGARGEWGGEACLATERHGAGAGLPPLQWRPGKPHARTLLRGDCDGFGQATINNQSSNIHFESYGVIEAEKASSQAGVRALYSTPSLTSERPCARASVVEVTREHFSRAGLS